MFSQKLRKSFSIKYVRTQRPLAMITFLQEKNIPYLQKTRLLLDICEMTFCNEKILPMLLMAISHPEGNEKIRRDIKFLLHTQFQPHASALQTELLSVLDDKNSKLFAEVVGTKKLFCKKLMYLTNHFDKNMSDAPFCRKLIAFQHIVEVVENCYCRIDDEKFLETAKATLLKNSEWSKPLQWWAEILDERIQRLQPNFF